MGNSEKLYIVSTDTDTPHKEIVLEWRIWKSVQHWALCDDLTKVVNETGPKSETLYYSTENCTFWKFDSKEADGYSTNDEITEENLTAIAKLNATIMSSITVWDCFPKMTDRRDWDESP